MVAQLYLSGSYSLGAKAVRTKMTRKKLNTRKCFLT